MYARDLAYIHHHGFGDFAQQFAPGLLRIFREAGIHGALVVDLGCGSGIWARALLDKGYDVLGVDPSASMLELARQQAPAASFLQSSAYRAALPACVAVTALGEVLSYHRRSVRGPSRLPALFRRVAQALPIGACSSSISSWLKGIHRWPTEPGGRRLTGPFLPKPRSGGVGDGSRGI